MILNDFQRASNASEFAEGIGLGLALCKRLVELHHGDIGFKSDVGIGTTFWLELPILADSHSQDTWQEAEGEFSSMNIQRIIVADADLDRREKICHLLESWSHFVTGVSTGAKVVEILNDIRPGIIMMRVRLPDMTALELLRRIQEVQETPPAVVLLSSVEIPDASERGFLGTLTFPFQIDQLVRMLKSSVARSNCP